MKKKLLAALLCLAMAATMVVGCGSKEAEAPAEDAAVEETVSITMTKTLDEVNGIKVASFLTTRYVPAGTEVIETGVIYVKDASYGALSIAEVGKTSAAGKAVKVATCDKTTSGQYKLTASYVEGVGIKAVGFITYIDAEGNVKTIYTEELSVPDQEITEPDTGNEDTNDTPEQEI